MPNYVDSIGHYQLMLLLKDTIANPFVVSDYAFLSQ